MKKIILLGTVLLLFLGLLILSLCSSPNENYLQAAKEATTPNYNFLFARNASLFGRIGMTLTGKRHKTCINTVTSFFNKYHTCSNCEDFEKNPEKWNFKQTSTPEVGDIIIQHDTQTGRAYHASLIVRIENGRYCVNHAVRTKYMKNVELKNKTKLTFYRFISNYAYDMIIHYNFKCPNCEQEHFDLIEGTMCFGDDSIFQIYRCEKCNTLKDLSQHQSHTCKCGNEMILWDYSCLVCGSLMGKEESGVYDML